MSCPHLANIRRISNHDMSHKYKCDNCAEGSTDIWFCLQNCCSFVGCGRLTKNHIDNHHQKTDHALYLCQNDRQVWCFGCDRKIEETQLSFSQDIENHEDGDDKDENSDSDNGGYMDEDMAMIDQEYFDGFEKGMKPRGLTGLTNIGNTCYMNSALQALSNSPSLMQFFLECPGYVRQFPHVNLSEHYRMLVTDMWSKKRQGSVTPTAFLHCVQKLNPQFRGYRQQDAQEFLRVLMDILHEELKEPVPTVFSTKEQLNQHDNAATAACRSKRLLGGTTVVNIPGNNETSGTQKKWKFKKYNLRSYSRRKAEKESSQNKEVTEVTARTNTPQYGRSTRLANSRSCPELREDHSTDTDTSITDTTTTGATTIKMDSKEPLTTMGFVNLASDSTEDGDGHVTRSGEQNASGGDDTGGGSSDLERAVSDSEINYSASKTTRSDSRPVEYSSVISDLFNGKIRSSVQCLTCKKISCTMETFQDLSLPIPGKEELSAIHSTTQCNPINGRTINDDSKSIIKSIFDWINSWLFGPRVTFEDCLAAFFSADELKGDNMYRCEHCSMLRNGIKECRVYKLPEMLCSHLKRFRHEFYHSSKISSFISFPLEELDVRKYLTNDFTGQCTKYDLVAVITHHGSVGGGHYVAYCKNFITNKWYEFNDSCVTEVPSSYVQDAEAYVLFYRKRGEQITKLRQKFFRMSKNEEDSEATHYVSKKWMTMFYTCSEPGPITNTNMLCKHGGIDPMKEPYMKDLVVPLPKFCWEFLLKKFGGGPEVANLDPCSICERQIIELDERRLAELDAVKELWDNCEVCEPQFFISLKWFKEWKNFVDGVNKEPPGPINNHRIGIARRKVPKSVWLFLHGTYGGNPTLPAGET